MDSQENIPESRRRPARAAVGRHRTLATRDCAMVPAKLRTVKAIGTVADNTPGKERRKRACAA